ncbi:glycerol-3-phosphate dehydrogenase/oxidase [Bacillus sp. S/N-304-OC-R1]|uniref:glycerol-3-phosphate dehydrogenase/oxidase n=1 Tax=Bacillus sp. S/N-304-OC-R1 TaxID=2758034 RepID=UPI001C8D75BE|nr:FAD-dependent oxidoreductase [Bacillus sp. S/N-304-OC-R1]MBY0123531.1 FAD-dependent oxidoreductase [Bacillus sp. S/N-304-OC-R1]
MEFSQKNRNQMKQSLMTNEFEVLVIGGGITGAGIALDAVTRGMKTALVEMQDFGAGTSSRSTKLVHGGLRYLKQFEVKMVAEVGKEREVVYENGPHVTTPEWMLLPLHAGGNFGKFSTSIGLRVYDYLAGVKKSERRKMLGIQETLNKEPLIKKEGLKGGGFYVEYRTDDARLTIEVTKAAFEKNAVMVNYTKVKELLYKNGKVIGATVHDQLSGETYDIFAEKVINATGPWVDTIREKDGSKKGKTLQLTKGVHLVIDQQRFPLKQAIYFDTPDGRMIFAIPRSKKVYVGTTDTFFNNDLVSPRATNADREYIIDAVNYMFPDVKLITDDIESSWAGIRPLILEEGKKPSEISRKDEIWESETGLITIAGGKLTGYRKMSEMVVDLIVKKIEGEKNKTFPTCRTKKYPISGGRVGGSKGFPQFIKNQIKTGINLGLSEEETTDLSSFFGSNINRVFNLIDMNKDSAEKYGLPLPLFAKLLYALEEEMAATPLDFWYRRTGYLLFDIELVRKYKYEVLEFMADYFSWSEKEKENHLEELYRELLFACTPADK